MSRADQQAQTRKALMRAAAGQFTRCGYHAATVDEIARKAGFTRGAFYANFRDKGDVFLAVLVERYDRDLRRLADSLENVAGNDVPERIGEWMERVLVAGDLRRAMAEFALEAETSPIHRARLADHLRAIRNATAAIVERYRAHHGIELAVDDATFATIAAALVGGVADLMRLEPDAASKELVTLAIAALWDGFRR